ncbi:MAG: DUF3710 domain-containing protein [Sciscionella sp.]|nr:DUF3710 domain-containing protein [Sciscionella sp.]
MGLFGRGKGGKRAGGRHAAPEIGDDHDDVDDDVDDDFADDEDDLGDADVDNADVDAADVDEDTLDEGVGPFDEADAPDDDVARLDIGCLRIPVPNGTQLHMELDPTGPVRAVHMITPLGQLQVSAYAAPKSSGLWADMSIELAEHLRSQGAQVSRQQGPWGKELSASVNDVALRFVGVDGPRWMLRGQVAGPHAHAPESRELLYHVVRGTVVVRGEQAMPVGTPLPIEPPAEVVEQIKQAQQAQAQQQAAAQQLAQQQGQQQF